MNQVNNEVSARYETTLQRSLSTTEDEILDRAVEILRARMHKQKIWDAMTSPDVVRAFVRLRLQLLEHEEFHVLFLDNQHVLIEHQSMFRGTIDGASVYPREVAKEALKLNAAAVILAHNHPSGTNEPSYADKLITNKLKEALGMFDIRVLDHLIVGKEIYSFAENGLI